MPDHPSRLTGLRAALARAWLIIRHRWLGRRYGRLVVEAIDGVPLVVLPEVFNPVLFRGGEMLARTIAAHPRFDQPGMLALDLGCGSGVVSVFAARRGARVIAADINPAAVRCARLNALLNGVEAQVEAREGDLFGPVEDDKFDLVIFNPPFFLGQPQNALDYAWRGETVFERFATGLRERLRVGGSAWILLSTDGAGKTLLALLAAQGFTLEILTERRWWNEVMTVYSATPIPEA